MNSDLRSLIEQQMPAIEHRRADVDGWPEELHIRLIRGDQWPILKARQEKHQGNDAMMSACVIAMCACDGSGDPIYDIGNDEDLLYLARLPFARQQRLCSEIIEYNEFPKPDGDPNPTGSRPMNGSGTQSPRGSPTVPSS